ncbi:DUF2062 domain-containing protein [Psychrobacter okhotskensis]|nr:DUF2062 domain-containing protein [Psychrobacter okhotskensis]NRD70861.1 DUF2062 domain-containing protein [Psychrobacter okhotskensis]PKG36325.1 DUF2062 domain-containing protein [Psychrobacter sp. Sarcosine-3u-12]
MITIKGDAVSQKRLKNLLPTPEKILESRILKLFAPHLADPRLWHFNRHSLNKAVYIGVLSAFFPLPGQMLLALIGSLIFRANVPMALGLTWITNPVTSLPIFYAGYYIGAKILDVPMISLRLIGRMIADFSLWALSDGANPFITYQGTVSLTAFCVGITILAVITSIVCGLAFKAIWRYKTVTSWQKRQHKPIDKTPKR